MKKGKPLKSAHTSNSQRGMGDYYGSGVKAKMGKIVDVMGNRSVKKTGKPPRSLA